jgi:hypothetical protein
MSSEAKLDRLPSVLFRAFGDYEPTALSGIMPGPLVNDVTILTTSGSIDKYKNAASILATSKKISVIDSEMNDEEAKSNSGKFLNTGLAELKKRGEKYATLVASGYEQLEGLPNIQNIFMNAYYLEPDADVYFIISPSIHPKDLSDKEFLVAKNKTNFFPSESLAMIKLSTIPPFDEELSQKGFLGEMDDGTPLGGVELIITLLKKYKETGYVPKMVGIFAQDLKRKIGIVYEHLEDSRSAVLSYTQSGTVETTPTRVKIRRRNETINRALKELGLTTEDYEKIFSQTTTYNAEHFPSNTLFQNQEP